MPKITQKGFSSIVLIFILLAGLAAGIYLVQQRTNFLPQAAKNKSTSEISKKDFKKKIKKMSIEKYSEAKKKFLKAKDEQKEAEQIEGGSEMVVSAKQYENDVNDLKKNSKNNKNKKLLDNLDKYNKKVQKEIRIALAHNRKIKDGKKYDQAIEKFRNKKQELLALQDTQLEKGDIKEAKLTSDDLLEQSINEGLTVAQKESATKPKLSLMENLFNIFIPNSFAAPGIHASEEETKAKEAEEKLNKLKGQLDRIEDLISAVTTNGVTPFGPIKNRQREVKQEILEAAYEYGYALGMSLSIAEIDAELANIELDRATPEERELAAGLQKAKAEKEAAEAAAAGAPPADAPAAAPEGAEPPAGDTFGGQQDSADGQSTGSDNPGQE